METNQGCSASNFTFRQLYCTSVFSEYIFLRCVAQRPRNPKFSKHQSTFDSPLRGEPFKYLQSDYEKLEMLCVWGDFNADKVNGMVQVMPTTRWFPDGQPSRPFPQPPSRVLRLWPLPAVLPTLHRKRMMMMTEE